MTWLLVRMWPALSMTKPEPSPRAEGEGARLEICTTPGESSR